MRSIWNGAISFGLVSIPIKLVNATESHSISFRQIHTADGGRIRYRKVCELDGEEVATADIGKAYEEPDGVLVPITDEDLAALPLPTAKTIEIVAFVPADEIDPLQMDAAYYLAANGVPAAKPYTLLREALKRSRQVAIAKFALRGRERLGMLRVVDDVIAMHGLLWPDEIRAPEGVAPDAEVTVRDAELDLADALMATLGTVDINELHDDYRTAVEAMITRKAAGEVLVPAAETEPGGQVIDLMAALEKSVRAAREARGETGAADAAATDEADGSDGADGSEEASVTPLRPKARTATGKKAGAAPAKAAARGAPKAVGGKKSTAAAAAKPAARAVKSASKTSRTAKTSGTAASAKKTTAKTATARTAKTAAAKSAAAKKSTASGAKSTTAKKTTARKRAS
ncbi:non-homologous end joining protein Ku [Streptomyces sp. NBC_00239]|uniref:non-homologous end joining protein Ku n=1 Tax=Streptomyces sp. NBC_00239 TaxID=2903640 RepID=UPI002E2B264D|nr:Ku protein [Streptomyces sp. NBC_00239]